MVCPVQFSTVWACKLWRLWRLASIDFFLQVLWLLSWSRHGRELEFCHSLSDQSGIHWSMTLWRCGKVYIVLEVASEGDLYQPATQILLPWTEEDSSLSWHPWGWWKDKDRWPNLMQLMSLSRHAKHELLTFWLSLLSWISFIHLTSYRYPRGFGPLLHCSILNLPPLFLIVLVPLADSGMEPWPCMQKHSSAIQVCEGIQHLHSNGLLP